MIVVVDKERRSPAMEFILGRGGDDRTLCMGVKGVRFL